MTHVGPVVAVLDADRVGLRRNPALIGDRQEAQPTRPTAS
jgi:hypothetical protein